MKLPILLPLVALIAGCSGLANKIEGNVDGESDRASRLTKDVGRTAPGSVMPSSPLVKHEDGIWLGKTAIKLGQPSLPPIFYEPTTFDRTINSLTELAERITLRSGVPSKVSPDALEVSSGAFHGRGRGLPGRPGNAGRGQAPNTPADAQGMLPLPLGLPGEAQASPVQPGRGPAANTGQSQQTFTDTPNGVRISYNSGSLKGLLDTAAARFGVSWKFSDGVIQFFHTESRNFQISAIPGDSTFSATVTSGASSTGGTSGTNGGGSGGGVSGGSGSTGVNANNTQNTAVASKLSVYTGLEAAIKVMLSPYGKVLASPATGSITVVDTPDSLERISAYIDGENKSLSRQIAINVTVLSVALSDSDQYGINWNAVYNSLSAQFGLRNSYAGDATTGLVSFTAALPSTNSSRFSGSSALIEALSQQGRVRRQTTASVVTLNNQPVPVQVARQTSYLQSMQTSLVAQVGSSTSITPGVVTAGFNMSILPHVLTNGTVMLQFSTDISTLRSIRTITGTTDANGRVTSQIQAPELDTRNFLQRVSMKSNETLIISGFEQTDEDLGRSGVGEARNMALGGGFSANKNKEVIVVLITPVTVGSPS